MAQVDFISEIYYSTKRDYQKRFQEHDQAACAEVACQFGKDYWDGDRKFGFGGYHYDGRWRSVAERMVEHYGLSPEASVLEVGCGKGFLLYEFTRVAPHCRVAGLDISEYAVANGKEEIRPFLQVGSASRLPYPDHSFDLVVSITCLQALYSYDLFAALKEMQRVGRGPKLIIVPAYRNEREKVNLMCYQLTCRAILTPAEWEWLFEQTGYDGDCQFLYYE